MRILHTILLLALWAPAFAQWDEGDASRDWQEPLYPDVPTAAWLRSLGDGWGYNVDSLLADVARWRTSPRVAARVIGNSVQGRDIWEVVLSAPAPLVTPRHVVTVHARTHPNEVQSTRVINAMIEHLLSDDPMMRRLLDSVTFVMVPMLNPDGVELGRPRENANGIDLERNWDKDPMQPEVAALKARYASLMSSTTPIRIALNLHSAYTCKRFFVYHLESATSARYAAMQQRFITSVRSYYPDGIEPWSFNQTWQGGAPTHFPESWFWFTHGDSVLALTYEDMNCPSAGAYDTTAYAILRGIADELGIDVSADIVTEGVERVRLLRYIAPNPFRSSTTVSFALPRSTDVTVRIFSSAGREVATLADGRLNAGWHALRWDADDVPSGVYYCTLQSGETVNTVALVKID